MMAELSFLVVFIAKIVGYFLVKRQKKQIGE